MQVPYQYSDATSHSAISVVNALATGLGATIGVDIDCKARASFQKKTNSREKTVRVSSNFEDRHELIETCAKFALRHLGQSVPSGNSINITIDSKIPPAVGLKSSSAVSTATVKAILGIFGGGRDSKIILDLSCKASKASGASLTGAYDDATACFLGGLALTNNSRFEIVKRSRVPKELGSFVLILLPTGKRRLTSSIDRSVYSRFKKESTDAFQYALKGNVPQAMLLNSIVQCVALHYSFEPISSALLEGASASGITGKGPAVAVLCSSSRTAERIKKAWLENAPQSRIIETRVLQPSIQIEK